LTVCSKSKVTLSSSTLNRGSERWRRAASCRQAEIAEASMYFPFSLQVPWMQPQKLQKPQNGRSQGCSSHNLDRAVKSNSTRGNRLCPRNHYWPPRIFRTSYGPEPNILTEAGAESAGPFLHVAVFVVHDDDYLVFGCVTFDALIFDAITIDTLNI
jgi:hypothetical protein